MTLSDLLEVDISILLSTAFCEAGYESYPECTACLRGFYRDNVGLNRFGGCLPCTDNFTTDGEASETVAACSVRKFSETIPSLVEK